MRLRIAAALVTLGLLAAAAPVYAHHSFAAEFDSTKPLNMKGTLLKLDWVNPHSWVHFEVTLPNGQKQVWRGETPSPNQLVRMGWAKSTIQPGDEILVSGFAAKDGTTTMWASTVNLVARDGRALEQPKQVFNMFAQNPDAVPGALLPAK
jgi:hypothetical protein